ncbi:MAG: hypothetical protein ACI9S8_000571 [Chlamydiales bacterium]|jgi:hypothetical protein
MQRASHFLAFFFSFFLLSSCASYKVQTQDLQVGHKDEFTTAKAQELRKEGRNHWLYVAVPRHRSQIQWYDMGHWSTWGLLGNDDDGIFGEEPTAGDWSDHRIGSFRALEWGIRNPLHNFTFYVIGTAQFENSEVTFLKISREGWSAFDYASQGGTVFAGKGTSFFLGLHGWRPFISLRVDYGRLLEFYLGWRARGNFGFKFLPAKKRRDD